MDIIRASYKKRDEKLNLSKNSHKHSYLSFDELKNAYDKGVEMYGYYDNNLQIAFLSLNIRKDNIKIKDIVVPPSYQNKGIGTILLDFVEEIAIKTNKKK